VLFGIICQHLPGWEYREKPRTPQYRLWAKMWALELLSAEQQREFDTHQTAMFIMINTSTL